MMQTPRGLRSPSSWSWCAVIVALGMPLAQSGYAAQPQQAKKPSAASKAAASLPHQLSRERLYEITTCGRSS